MSEGASHLEIFLIRPTKYDDDGYLLRHRRGVLPSNTLACMWTLTRTALRQKELAHVSGRVHAIDESVQRVPLRTIGRILRKRRSRVVVCLVGVQTSQLPRASDLALRLRALGATVLVGGFHVSGRFAFGASPTRELETLTAAGVTLVTGEVEETWPSILRDAARGCLAPRYDTLDQLPDLASAPVPRLPPQMLRRFAYQRFATIDGGRGCPFQCSFCTIINVQGRRSRSREPEQIAAAIRDNWRDHRVGRYFFTDDDFARNPRANDLMDELIRLREEEGLPIRFLMQVDLLAHRIPGFVERARRAGCFQVFLGMESLDGATLSRAGKRQNRVGEYAELVSAWREAGALVHAGYIVGFPEDTPARVHASVERLKRELRIDVASFFMLTPLPGSADHRALAEDTRRTASLEPDLNRWDTFHPVMDHPRMSRTEWHALYRDCWTTFYTNDHMLDRLRGAPPDLHTTLLQIYLWYLTSIRVERFHPMMSGFLRQKPRRDRRPGFPIESIPRYSMRRAAELGRATAGHMRVLRQIQGLWKASSRTSSHRRPIDWISFAYEAFLAGDLD